MNSNRYRLVRSSVRYLFGSLAGLVKMSAAVERPLHQLVPAGLDAEQQILDENHVLFQAGKTKLRASLLQSQDLLSVGVHLVHKHLDGHEVFSFNAIMQFLEC